MKTLCTTLLIFAGAITCYDAVAVELTRQGEPVSEIVIDAAQSLPPIKFAGQELQQWIKKISGAELPIVDVVAETKTQIILGTPDTSPAIHALKDKYADDLSKLEGNDGFAIRKVGTTIYIFASKPKGVLNGVFFFLEQNTDIVFVRPRNGETGSGTIFGDEPNLTATKTAALEIPAFNYIRSLGEGNVLWQTRMRNLIMVQDIPRRNTRKRLDPEQATCGV